MKKLADNKILLHFENPDTADYVKKMCSRKGTRIEDYLIQNLEWDTKLFCLVGDFPVRGKLTKECCYRCEFTEVCPDVVR